MSDIKTCNVGYICTVDDRNDIVAHVLSSIMDLKARFKPSFEISWGHLFVTWRGCERVVQLSAK